MGRRVESPSSINIYRQCPRRYYFQYIEKIPTRPSVHLARGSVAHKVFATISSFIPKNKEELYEYSLRLLKKYWDDDEFFKKDRHEEFFQETSLMVINWLNQFTNKIDNLNMDFVEGFNFLKPKLIEEEYRSENYQVRGFIDVVEEVDGKIRLMDYKTSKLKPGISEDYKLQLGIYALLYNEKNQKKAENVGIYFLRGEEKILDVDDRLVEFAKEEIKKVHDSTDSDQILDYGKNKGPLCNYCDFYDKCFGKKDLNDY